MVSSVMEGHKKKLRRAGYLASDNAHRLPEKGQLIPTPRPHERVVFLPHLLRGLGFPLHPFARGLMFYYGLDFHNLAPNFVLNIKKDPPFHPRLLPPLPIHSCALELQRPSPHYHLNLLQSCPEREASGWSPPSRRDT